MKNCLVTKLRETVNNDRLFKIGEIAINVYANKPFVIALTSVSTESIPAPVARGIGDVFGNGSSTLTAKSSTTYGAVWAFEATPNEDGIVIAPVNYSRLALKDCRISDVDKLKYLPSFGLRINSLDDSTNVNVFKPFESKINELSIIGAVGDTEKLPNCPGIINGFIKGNTSDLSGHNKMSQFINASNEFEGDISNLAGMTNVQYLTISAPKEKVYGDIMSLVNLPNLIQLYVSFNSNIIGSKSAFNAARTSAGLNTVKIIAAQTGVTE